MSVRLKLEKVGEAERDGHIFFLHIEEATGESLALVEGEFCRQPWLRPACSCGWVAEHRFTLEENAHWHWLNHHVEGNP